MNVIAIITSDNTVLNSNKRWIEVSPTEASAIFGSYSDVASWANIVGATKPNATQVGGKLIVAYHRATKETVAQRMSSVEGTQIDVPVFLSEVKTVSGDIQLTLGETDYVIEGIDFSDVESTEDVLQKLSEVEAPVTFSYKDDRFIATAKQADGDLVLRGEVAGFLGLTLGAGATLVGYQEGGELEPETRLEALTALKAEVNVKGVAFIDRLLDTEVLSIAEWATANQTLVYEVFNNEKYTKYDNENPCWKVKMAGLKTFRMLWGKDRRYAAAYMARMHTVNFNGENTALTMHLKELPIVPEPISDDLWTKLDKIGLDPYTTTKDTANVLCSSGNDYVDNEYNLMALVNHVQTDLFNLLKMAHTKLAQTEPDGQLLVDQCERTSRRFRRANVIAPGAWTNPNILGNRDVFLRAIENEGFYWQIGSFVDQPQSDRERRIAPVIQGAIKNAGAIHKADVLINFNK